ncbi:MAG: hypothetical protein PHG63_00165 [Candidatus Dojkabacteria bacterium]|nr:hypothetical protein [Candidatus Dojkabacteria bacterium]
MTMGSLKKLLYNFVIGSMIFFIVVVLLPGIRTSGMLLHWLMAFAVYNVGLLIVPQTLRFLTLPRNFLTYWVFSAVTSFASIYAISMFVPGLTIHETLIDPVKLGIVTVDPYTLSKDLTMIAAAVLSGFMNSALIWLKTTPE